jgi:hypothetical protein
MGSTRHSALILLILLGACSHDGFTVEVQEDAVATVQGKKAKSLHKGERVNSEGAPVLVEAPGKLGLIVVPVGQDVKTVKAQLKPFSAFNGAVLQAEANDLVSRILPEVVEVQSLLARHQNEAALSKAGELASRYPAVSYLKLLKVSCLIVNDRADDARKLLDEAMTALPNDPMTAELAKTLAGGAPAKAKARAK